MVQVLAAGSLVVGGVGTLAGSALAASVPARPAPGPTGCAALSQRFGGGASWTQIRFSTLPAVGGSSTGAAGAVSVTITRTSETTLAWQATDGIALAWVNAGRPPNATSAAYVYDPPATGDSGLSGIGGIDPLQHALFCYGVSVTPVTAGSTTTKAPTTSSPDTTVATSAPPETTPPTATVRSFPALTPTVPQVTTPRQVVPTTVASQRLPETGADAGALAAIGVSLLGLGVVALSFTRRRSAH